MSERYKSILKKLKQLLLTLDESSITGIFKYSFEPDLRNLYIMTDLTNFETIRDIIINFKDKYEKVIWNIFINKGANYNVPSNIIISNTHVSILITYMLSRNGLNRFRPYP